MLVLVKGINGTIYSLEATMAYTKKNYVILHHHASSDGYIFIKCGSGKEAKGIVEGLFREEKVDLTDYQADGLPYI